jgi:hypothetical protein
VSPSEYAHTINRSARAVQNWCNAGLIGRRVGAHWEIEEGTPPPVIIPKHKKKPRRTRERKLENFKREFVTADRQ